MEYITRLKADSRTIAFPSTQDLHFSAYVMKKDDGSLEFRDPKITTPAGEFTKETLKNPKVELVPVHDSRFGDAFNPPERHLGKDIEDKSPPAIAELAIGYLEQLLDEASKLPQRF